MDQPEEKKEAEKKGSVKEFLSVGDAFTYFFRRKKKGEPDNLNIRIMHGINKFAIIVFLLGVIYLILKRLL